MGIEPSPFHRAVAGLFEVPGELEAVVPYGSGHINDTFLASYRGTAGEVRLIHQRINTQVFKDPDALMENVVRVTEHIRAKLAQEKGTRQKVLTLIPTRDGRSHARDEAGRVWRTYEFISGARSYDRVQSPAQAFEAGRAFGRFQAQLVDLPGPRLHDTIPDFHNAVKRFEALERAVEGDRTNGTNGTNRTNGTNGSDLSQRLCQAQHEVDFALARRDMAPVLLDLQARGELPERITHNDTKFNNVMLDDKTGEAVCVVDLDTAMPGLAGYDFGDMVRTTTSPSDEDERDLSKVEMSVEMYEALLRGYLDTAREFLADRERETLAFSGKLITFVIGIRFLTDYLQGDTYFKVHREGHNLDRCRTQFKLIESMERQERAMDRALLAFS